MPFWLAVSRLEQAEPLGERRRRRQRLLAEARETFERLEATPWLERAGATPPARRPGASCRTLSGLPGSRLAAGEARPRQSIAA